MAKIDIQPVLTIIHSCRAIGEENTDLSRTRHSANGRFVPRIEVFTHEMLHPACTAITGVIRNRVGKRGGTSGQSQKRSGSKSERKFRAKLHTHISILSGVGFFYRVAGSGHFESSIFDRKGKSAFHQIKRIMAEHFIAPAA